MEEYDGNAKLREPKKKLKKKKSPAKEELLPDPQDNIIAANSIKKSTKATFDLYLEQAQANIARERKSSPKKGKSKKQKEGEEVLLENLRNSSDFQKDKDEETKRRNTYDPDETKEKSNRRRDRQRKLRSSSSRPPRPLEGSENIGYESESSARIADPSGDAPMTIDELSSQKKTKRSKKFKEEIEKEEAETTFIEEQENISPKKTKKSRKGKKGEPEEKEVAEAAPTLPPVEFFHYTDDSKVAGVIIHKSDKLRSNFLLQHPLVRVHIIDVDTGQYLIKQDKNRPATSFYEMKNREEAPDFILPVMTQTFDFKEMKTMVPWWDEMLIFNENFNYLLQETPNVVVFFEVLDFVSMNRASRNQGNQFLVKGDEGWHKEAWAFLKLRGANGKLNVDKQLRLQLFEIPRSKVGLDQVPVYHYWKDCVRRSYPSSLYVTVRSVLPPDVVEPASRSMFPTQEERGTMTLKQIQEALSRSNIKDTTEEVPSNWSRLPGQMCKLPNTPLLNLPAGKMGCLVMSFSHDGRYLACGCHDKSSNPILVYEIPSGHFKASLTGHYNNIYEISWSRGDHYILSASSDGTARVWDLNTEKCKKMLPHPTFVYCAKFHPRVSKVIVTGSYDNVVRVWHMDGAEMEADLKQELDQHMYYVNSLCFDEEGTKLFSADSGGIIKIWNVFTTEKATKKGVSRDWNLNSTIENEELKDQVISYLSLHPNGRKLLVQTKDNTIRMLDLRMMTVTQRYVGALNFREIIHSDITVCGTFVLGGSEDGCAYVWNTETGDQVAVYTDLNYSHAVNDVKFHPLDHIVAFSSRGDNHKVQIFKYEYNWADKDAKNYYTLVNKSQSVLEKTNPLPSAEEEATSKPKQDLTLQIETKKQRAMNKLRTVMEFNTGLERQRQRHADLNAMTSTMQLPNTVGMTGTWSSTGDWGSTFDYSRPNSLGPTIMSPHARQSGETEAMRNHLSSQMDYMKGSAWRPGFSSIGSRGDKRVSMNMSMPSQGNPKGNFTLQGADEIQPIGEVIALYDYLAQRSDELTFHKDDIITIYYKDTEQWWMGMLKTTGAHGFVPSNYVEGLNDGDGKLRASKKEHITTAVVDNGQLKFLSGAESDASSGDNLATTPRKKQYVNRRSRTQEKKNKSGASAANFSFEHLLK